MAKTLKNSTFFNTKVSVNIEVCLRHLYSSNTTFFINLLDGTWVVYQWYNREMIKAESLGQLLKKTYKIDLDTFHCYATPLSKEEKDIIIEIFLLNDNFNLDTDEMYKIQ